MAFLDAFPATEGHTLVIPKRHAEDLLTLDVREAEAVMRATHSVARLLDERLQPDGLNVLQANGSAAWQSVFHMHVHVVPRYEGDGLRHTWDAAQGDPRRLSAIQEQLRG